MKANITPFMSGEHPVDAASCLVGGRDVLAKQLKVSVAAIGNWKSRGVPAERCPLIERLTNGQVRCEALRPDVDWEFIRETAKEPNPRPEKAGDEVVA